MIKRKKEVSTEHILEALLKVQKKVRNIGQWRQLQAIWLRERLNLSGPEVARLLNYRLQTVHLLWHKWLQQGLKVFSEKKARGGRTNAYMTVDEEREFLRPLLAQTADGRCVAAREIKEAFEARVGVNVPKSTIYRMLHRHGWRKAKSSEE